jgi:hypothetical protein
MKTLLSILFVFVTASCCAAELTPLRQANLLGAHIQGASLPDSFHRDLTSGLTNRLMIRLTLHQAARELRARSIEIAIRYDLWDETFTMMTTIDGAKTESAVFKEAQQVIHRLQAIRLPELFATSDLPAESELTLRAIVLLNPIDRERMDAIREWVGQNTKRSSLDPAGALSVGDLSVSNAIFNRIFEQYASGQDVASAWQQTLATKPFRLIGLSQESH